MASINIDGKDYESDDMSDKAKANLISMQFAREELKRLEAKAAVCKTAERAYATELKKELDSSES